MICLTHSFDQPAQVAVIGVLKNEEQTVIVLKRAYKLYDVGVNDLL